jgi:hypothetical protein
MCCVLQRGHRSSAFSGEAGPFPIPTACGPHSFRPPPRLRRMLRLLLLHHLQLHRPTLAPLSPSHLRLASVPGAQVAGSDGGRAADIGSPAPARTWGPGDADPVNSTRGGTPYSGSASSRPGARGGAGTNAASWRERAGLWLRALHQLQRRSPGLAPLHRIPAAGGKEKEVAGKE